MLIKRSMCFVLSLLFISSLSSAPYPFFDETLKSIIPVKKIGHAYADAIENLAASANELFDSNTPADGPTLLQELDRLRTNISQKHVMTTREEALHTALEVATLKHVCLHLLSITQEKVATALMKMLMLYDAVRLELHDKNSKLGRARRKLRQLLRIRTLTHDDMQHHRRELETTIDKLAVILSNLHNHRQVLLKAKGRVSIIPSMNNAACYVVDQHMLTQRVRMLPNLPMARAEIERAYQQVETEELIAISKISYRVPGLLSSYILPLTTTAASLVAMGLTYKCLTADQRAPIDGAVDRVRAFGSGIKNNLAQWCRDAKNGAASLFGYGNASSDVRRAYAVEALSDEVRRLKDQFLIAQHLGPERVAELRGAIDRRCDFIENHLCLAERERDQLISGLRHALHVFDTGQRNYQPGDGAQLIPGFERDFDQTLRALDAAHDGALLPHIATLRRLFKQYVYIVVDHIDAPPIWEELTTDANTLVDAVCDNVVGVVGFMRNYFRGNIGIADEVRPRAHRYTETAAIGANALGSMLGPVRQSASRVLSVAKHQAGNVLKAGAFAIGGIWSLALLRRWTKKSPPKVALEQLLKLMQTELVALPEKSLHTDLPIRARGMLSYYLVRLRGLVVKLQGKEFIAYEQLLESLERTDLAIAEKVRIIQNMCAQK